MCLWFPSSACVWNEENECKHHFLICLFTDSVAIIYLTISSVQVGGPPNSIKLSLWQDIIWLLHTDGSLENQNIKQSHLSLRFCFYRKRDDAEVPLWCFSYSRRLPVTICCLWCISVFTESHPLFSLTNGLIHWCNPVAVFMMLLVITSCTVFIAD